MQQVFVDSEKNRIIKRIDGPYNNRIEVTFEKVYFNKVREIEKQFISIIAANMTTLSKSTCLYPWPLIDPNVNSNVIVWVPPKAFKLIPNNRLPNPYKKSVTNMEYALTSSLTLSYIDAETLGRRQVDILMTLVVKESTISSSITPSSTATTMDTTTSSPQTSVVLLEMQAAQLEAQQKFQL